MVEKGMPAFFLIYRIPVLPVEMLNASAAGCCQQNRKAHAHSTDGIRMIDESKGINDMKITNRAKEKGAMGYMLLWLIGIPIPVLFLIFLLRGCT